MYQTRTKFTPVVIRFKGNETVKEVYELHLKEFKQTLETLQTEQQLEDARQELMEMRAIVENKQAKLMGY